LQFHSVENNVSSISTESQSRRLKLDWPNFPLGFGTGRLCGLDGGLSIRRATWLLNQSFDLGIRLIDTAPTYGQGHAERAIGRLAPSVRDRFIICSKVGYSFGRATHWINAAKPFLRPILPWANSLRRRIDSARHQTYTAGKISLNIQPGVIRSTLEGSLKRIHRDRLDLLLLHDPSSESVDNPANQDELNRLVRSGKIRGWGVSSSDPDVLKRAIDSTDCSVVQFPVTCDWVNENPHIIPKCDELGVSIIANRVISSPAQQPNARTSSTSIEQCVSYALHQPAVRQVLCGTRSLYHLSQNVQIVRQLLS
jgi:aryl-alcohol dehydrogenase-like predicted oxidoreductase